MKAGADMKIAGKIACVSLLLIITKLKGTVGNNKKSAAVGDSFALICSNKSDVIMVTWKISPKTGGHCTLGYRADLNQTNRTNCTENMSWKSRPDRDPTLQIQPVGRASEGNYICEMATREGNFHQTYHLTVLDCATKANLLRLLPHIPYRMTSRRWNLILLMCRKKM